MGKPMKAYFFSYLRHPSVCSILSFLRLNTGRSHWDDKSGLCLIVFQDVCLLDVINACRSSEEDQVYRSCLALSEWGGEPVQVEGGCWRIRRAPRQLVQRVVYSHQSTSGSRQVKNIRSSSSIPNKFFERAHLTNHHDDALQCDEMFARHCSTIIAHISQHRQHWQWCTFSKQVYFWA